MYIFPHLTAYAEYLSNLAKAARKHAEKHSPRSLKGAALRAEAAAYENAAHIATNMKLELAQPEGRSPGRKIAVEEAFAKRAAEIKSGLKEG